MTSVSGSLGRIYSGYQLAAEVTDWQISKDDSTLNSSRTAGSGKLTRIDLFYITQPLSRLELHMGEGSWWVWDNPTVGGTLILGSSIEIAVAGNPRVVKR